MELKFNEKELGLVEIENEIMELDDISGAGYTWNLLWSGVVSFSLGNQGYVCTWTYECQSGCQ